MKHRTISAILAELDFRSRHGQPGWDMLLTWSTLGDRAGQGSPRVREETVSSRRAGLGLRRACEFPAPQGEAD